MGITIIHKSDSSIAKPFSKKALILSGGAVTGASFKAGGLKALNDYFANYSVNEFDIYVGISSGSLLATPIAAGISPEEILRSLDGTSKHFKQLAPWHFYRPNFGELIKRPFQFAMETISYFPRVFASVITDWRALAPRFWNSLTELIGNPTSANYSAFFGVITSALSQQDGPSFLKMLPTGLFDNAPIERYLRENIEANGLTNNFQAMERLRKKKLYICAMTLDSAERVVFGPDERRDATISEAVQASTALPFFYKPARVRGIDYIDGGVFSTAHIDVAVDKGADLIICYNPFRPVENHVFWEYIRKDNKYVTKGRPLTMNGITAVMNQVFRAVFHIRLHQSLRAFQDNKDFKGDIILIEPRASDMTFFELNPLIYSHRTKAARIGFESVRNSIDEHYDDMSKILNSHGIQINRSRIDADFEMLQTAGKDPQAMRRVLEGRANRTKKTNKSEKSKKKTKLVK